MSQKFEESDAYFKIIASCHRFLRDGLVTNDEKLNNLSKTSMIILLEDNQAHITSILRALVVCAINIDIQYTDTNNNDIEILPKLYTFLKSLNLYKNEIDTVYKMYNLTNIIKHSPTAATAATAATTTASAHKVNPQVVVKRQSHLPINIKSSRAQGGDIKNL